jgi:major membrane immunogen (membrane-anchored lipoprotein)
LFTAYHADGSETDHATRLEAHDALVESGSPSPFEVVTGSAVEAPQTHA